ncbi:MAG: hypothetical protein H6811_00045 [Phycisphaeraceae bacterium]|nr:hypothetical protein [Phycisphaeraceae bacterium]
MTADNEFDAYVGTVSTTVGSAVGTGSNWATAFNFSFTLNPGDYFYVASASDFGGAQGFLGEFTSGSQNLNTGHPAWEVFPVGKYLQQVDASWPSTWPALTMPTQTQVNQALAFAASNTSVWVPVSTFAGWDNKVVGNITTWGHNPGITPTAQWIWHNTGSGNPFNPGANHDEFLIFRITPAPSAMLPLLGAMAVGRRRRGA